MIEKDLYIFNNGDNVKEIILIKSKKMVMCRHTINIHNNKCTR
jgi:hypothetical protein